MMLGQQHAVLGEISQGKLGPLAACISVGSDAQSPSLAFKGDKAHPNEDGLLALRDGPRWLLAVADGHLGHQASHFLLEDLAARCKVIPSRLGQLSVLLSGLEWPSQIGGGTTLLLACLDETTRRVAGFSFGDSSLLAVSSRGVRLGNRHDDNFIRPPLGIAVENGSPFELQLDPSEMLLLFTDGINECCYRDPARSIQFQHIEKLWGEAPGNVELAQKLTKLALEGVDGYPGGQDNVAVLAYPAATRDLGLNS